MPRNTKSRGAESPALQKKAFVLTGQENDNITASALQDFSSCVPCALNPPDTPQPHARLVEDGGIDGHGPLHVEVAQGLRGCVHLVIMGRAGELRQFRDVLPSPRAMLGVRDQDVPGLEERGHGMGPGGLAAVRLNGNDAGHGVFQRVDHGWGSTSLRAAPGHLAASARNAATVSVNPMRRRT